MENVILRFVIPLNPRTKKNNQNIYVNKKTGKPFVSQNDRYKQYESAAGLFMPKLKEPINEPVNIRALYYRDSNRIVDLNGLNQCLHDVLVKYKVIEDDNSRIVVSTDGSRALFDKECPRTEIEITKASKGFVKCSYCRFSRKDFELYDGTKLDLVCKRNPFTWEAVESEDYCSKGLPKEPEQKNVMKKKSKKN